MVQIFMPFSNSKEFGIMPCGKFFNILLKKQRALANGSKVEASLQRLKVKIFLKNLFEPFKSP